MQRSFLTTNASPAGWLRRAALNHPQRTALVTDRGAVGYASLHTRLGRLAARYAAAGLVPGKPLASLTRCAARIAWAGYLALYCGCPFLPLDPRRGREQLLADCDIDQAVVDDNLDELLPAGLQRFPAEWFDEPAVESGLPPHPAPPKSTQLIIATSGTTGTARGVMLSGANLAAAVKGSKERLDLGPEDVWLACLPLVHIAGFSILLRCAEAGATALLHEGFEPIRIWEDLDRRKVTHLSVVPGMLSRLLDCSNDSPPPTSLRTVLVGGGPLSGTLAGRAREAGWPLCPTYGMSETASQIATLCALADDWQPGDVGALLPNVRVKIVDDAGQLTQQLGRIHIAGPTVMRGYANPEGVPGLGLSQGGFTSSDLGYLDPRGHLHVVGRVDEVLVSGGENIHPLEVEKRLSDYPGIQDVAVISRTDSTWGDRLIALVVGHVDEAALSSWCRGHLPPPLRPREFIKVTQIPRNHLGKIDRRVLRVWVASRDKA